MDGPELDNQDINVNAGENNDSASSAGSNWYDTLGDDFKANPSIQKFKSPTDLAKSYVNLEKMIGKDKVVLPNEKSTPEELNAFYNKLGKPQDISGYKTPELQIENKELLMKEQTLEAFKKKAHDLNLTDKQFAELYGFYHELNIESFNGFQQSQIDSRAKSETELRREWGNAYDSKVDSAQQVVNKYFKDAASNPGFNLLVNDVNFIKAMASIAESMREDGITGVTRSVLTPGEAQSQLNEIIGNTKHPFHDNTHPEHRAAIDKFISLQQAALAQ